MMSDTANTFQCSLQYTRQTYAGKSGGVNVVYLYIETVTYAYDAWSFEAAKSRRAYKDFLKQCSVVSNAV